MASTQVSNTASMMFAGDEGETNGTAVVPVC
jgi:hypothetical protein